MKFAHYKNTEYLMKKRIIGYLLNLLAMLSFLKKFDFFKFRDPEKKAIIELLKKKENCTFGEIIKSLNLSSSRGSQIINELKSKGVISNKIDPPYFKLARQ